MTAAQVLKSTRAEGISINIDGGDLVLEASAAPPKATLDAVLSFKAEILVLLRLEAEHWSVEEWHAHFNERAGLAEYDGGFPRSEAELCAFEACVDHWLTMHPPRVPHSGLCIRCGVAESPAEPSNIPIAGLGGDTGWLHLECAPKWSVSRRWEARRALSWLLEPTNRRGE
jgi:hypothetical protein